MLSNETIIKVTNRSGGSVSYSINDLGIHRHYEPNETKEIEYIEVLKLSYTSGGLALLRDYLTMDNAEAVQNILGDVEPEYFYNAADVKELLLNGSLPQLEDCLEFADKGVIDLIKKYAVDLQINDVAKRKAIFAKTGFNVNKAIEIQTIAAMEDSEEEAAATSRRRAAPFKQEEEKKPQDRQADLPKYKVVG